MPDYAALSRRARSAYERCKLFPERSPAGQIALLELRNMMPEIMDALDAAAEWFEPPRMKLGPGR